MKTLSTVLTTLAIFISVTANASSVNKQEIWSEEYGEWVDTSSYFSTYTSEDVLNEIKNNPTASGKKQEEDYIFNLEGYNF